MPDVGMARNGMDVPSPGRRLRNAAKKRADAYVEKKVMDAMASPKAAPEATNAAPTKNAEQAKTAAPQKMAAAASTAGAKIDAKA
ncbi:MAG: hypothetical protein HZB29_00740 [Nitrospinae bacterium]|nr:hypothetical protein [Nitrospinota bacterium]